MENMLVRFIPTQRDSTRGWSGNKPALCLGNGKSAHCIIITEGEISVVDLPLEIVRGSRVLSHPLIPGTPYPPERFIERIKSTKKPLSPKARRLLKEFSVAVKGAEVIPEAPPRMGRRGCPIVRQLSEEFGLPPPRIRRLLRKAGLRSPYGDEKSMRAALNPLISEEKRNGPKVQKGSEVSKRART